MLLSGGEKGLAGKNTIIFSNPGIFMRKVYISHMETNQTVESHWSNQQPCILVHLVGATP